MKATRTNLEHFRVGMIKGYMARIHGGNPQQWDVDLNRHLAVAPDGRKLSYPNITKLSARYGYMVDVDAMEIVDTNR